MEHDLITDGKFEYYTSGEGTPIIILHGLMGGLSNFQGVIDYFPKLGYQVVVPSLPLYTMPLIKTSVGTFAKHINKFIDHMGWKEVILLGNSLGGHIGLVTTKLYPKKIKALIITGSSGLYESAMERAILNVETMTTSNKRVKMFFMIPRSLLRRLSMRFLV